MTTAGTRSGACAAVWALAFVTLFASTAGIAAAAGPTDVEVTTERDALAPGDATTVEVVVERADGGVGALNAAVTLSDPAVASVESVTVHGDPRLKRVTERADGVRLSAVLADTEDAGSVAVATIVLRAEGAGQTAVDVDVRTLGDERGTAYSVGSVDRPTITVADDAGSSSDSRTRSEATSDEEASGSASDEEVSGSAGDEEASGSAGDEEAPGSTGDEEAPGSTGDEEAPGSAGDEEAPGSANNEEETPDNGGDGADGDGQHRSAVSAPTDGVTETVRSLASTIFGPVGAVGALVVIGGAVALRRLW